MRAELDDIMRGMLCLIAALGIAWSMVLMLRFPEAVPVVDADSAVSRLVQFSQTSHYDETRPRLFRRAAATPAKPQKQAKPAQPQGKSQQQAAKPQQQQQSQQKPRPSPKSASTPASANQPPTKKKPPASPPPSSGNQSPTPKNAPPTTFQQKQTPPPSQGNKPPASYGPETREQQQQREAAGHQKAREEQQRREAEGHKKAREEQQKREAEGHKKAREEQQTREAEGHRKAREEQQRREAAQHGVPYTPPPPIGNTGGPQSGSYTAKSGPGVGQPSSSGYNAAPNDQQFSPPSSNQHPPGAFAASPGRVISGPNTPTHGIDNMAPAQGQQFKQAVTEGISNPNIKALALAAASKETSNGRDGINSPLDARKQGSDAQNYGPMRMNKKMLTELGYSPSQMEQMNQNTPAGRQLAGRAFEQGVQKYGQKNGAPDIDGFYAYHSGGESQYKRWLAGQERPDEINGPRGRNNLKNAYETIQRTYEANPNMMTNNQRPYTAGDTQEH